MFHGSGKKILEGVFPLWSDLPKDEDGKKNSDYGEYKGERLTTRLLLLILVSKLVSR